MKRVRLLKAMAPYFAGQDTIVTDAMAVRLERRGLIDNIRQFGPTPSPPPTTVEKVAAAVTQTVEQVKTAARETLRLAPARSESKPAGKNLRGLS